jgi:hypothetical protein
MRVCHILIARRYTYWSAVLTLPITTRLPRELGDRSN